MRVTRRPSGCAKRSRASRTATTSAPRSSTPTAWTIRSNTSSRSISASVDRTSKRTCPGPLSRRERASTAGSSTPRRRSPSACPCCSIPRCRSHRVPGATSTCWRLPGRCCRLCRPTARSSSTGRPPGQSSRRSSTRSTRCSAPTAWAATTARPTHTSPTASGPMARHGRAPHSAAVSMGRGAPPRRGTPTATRCCSRSTTSTRRPRRSSTTSRSCSCARSTRSTPEAPAPTAAAPPTSRTACGLPTRTITCHRCATRSRVASEQTTACRAPTAACGSSLRLRTAGFPATSLAPPPRSTPTANRSPGSSTQRPRHWTATAHTTISPAGPSGRPSAGRCCASSPTAAAAGARPSRATPSASSPMCATSTSASKARDATTGSAWSATRSGTPKACASTKPQPPISAQEPERMRVMGPRTLVSAARRTGATARNAAEVLRHGGLEIEDESAPYEVVLRRRMYKLRRYFPDEPVGAELPAMVLVAPLMFTAESWDLTPRSSAVRSLHACGIDTWVVDFGRPENEPGGLERTLTDHVIALSDVVDEVRERTGGNVMLSGYSQGGMFGYQTTAYRRGDGIDSIVTYGSPVDPRAPLPFPLSPESAARLAQGALDSGVLKDVSTPRWLNVAFFKLLDPVQSARGELHFLRQLHDRDALLPRERQRRYLEWEGYTAYSGPAFAELLEQFLVHNRMVEGGFDVGDRLRTPAGHHRA